LYDTHQQASPGLAYDGEAKGSHKPGGGGGGGGRRKKERREREERKRGREKQMGP
jgi:hypothetical protein